MKNANGAEFNFIAQSEALFRPEHYDPKTTKPLVRVTGLVDEAGNPIPPFLCTCNTLLSMGEGAKLAMGIWKDQGPKTEGNA